jgi:hypothetical protein
VAAHLEGDQAERRQAAVDDLPGVRSPSASVTDDDDLDERPDVRSTTEG